MTPQDLALCRAMLAAGSQSFAAAAKLLPRHVRAPATALYAFCRQADDAVDSPGAGASALARLETRLDRVYAGEPEDCAVDRAFARVVVDYAIPRALPQALLEGFAWDLQRRQYATLADLNGYAARVAGTVGAMMACVMRAPRTAQALHAACELGVAMQLTNIARDVGEDARAGRLYLPHEWLVEAGIDPAAWLAAPRFSAALGEVVGRLLAVADRHYRGAEQGIADLPADCRGAIRAARLIYAEIGRVVERNGLDSVSQRAVTSSARKLALVAMAHVSAGRGKAGTGHSLPEVAFLVRAALDAAPARCTEEPAIAWWNLEARWGRALEMLVRLEAQQ